MLQRVTRCGPEPLHIINPSVRLLSLSMLAPPVRRVRCAVCGHNCASCEDLSNMDQCGCDLGFCSLHTEEAIENTDRQRCSVCDTMYCSDCGDPPCVCAICDRNVCGSTCAHQVGFHCCPTKESTLGPCGEHMCLDCHDINDPCADCSNMCVLVW